MTESRVRSVIETNQIRLALWHAVLGLLQLTHRKRFPGRRFGTDLDLLMVWGASHANFIEGKPINASKVGAYLDMPRENVRRRLHDLVRIGLLTRQGTSFLPTEQTMVTNGAHTEALLKALQDAADKLI
jgi:hypothetical protein